MVHHCLLSLALFNFAAWLLSFYSIAIWSWSSNCGLMITSRILFSTSYVFLVWVSNSILPYMWSHGNTARSAFFTLFVFSPKAVWRSWVSLFLLARCLKSVSFYNSMNETLTRYSHLLCVAIYLKVSRTVLGMMPGLMSAPLVYFVCIVCALPEPICPYANTVTF